MLSDSAILKHIARQSKRQAGYKQLVRELGLHGEERRELNDHLQKLVKSGTLIPIDSDHYALPQAAADKNLIAGRLTMHRDGFGFVIPDARSLDDPLKSKLAGRHLHSAAASRHRHAWRSGAGRSRHNPPRRPRRRPHRPPRQPRHATVVGIFHYGSRRTTSLLSTQKSRKKS